MGLPKLMHVVQYTVGTGAVIGGNSQVEVPIEVTVESNKCTCINTHPLPPTCQDTPTQTYTHDMTRPPKHTHVYQYVFCWIAVQGYRLCGRLATSECLCGVLLQQRVHPFDNGQPPSNDFMTSSIG